MIMIHDKNPEEIFLYHYIEEIISNYGSYFIKNLKDEDMTIKELSVLLRIRFGDIETQQDLVNVFNVSGAYIAKLLKKFEDNDFIQREELPDNRRKKTVKLTPEGVKKTDELISTISTWEENVMGDLTQNEIITLKKILFKIINKED